MMPYGQDNSRAKDCVPSSIEEGLLSGEVSWDIGRATDVVILARTIPIYY